jgi:hypothetical protein
MRLKQQDFLFEKACVVLEVLADAKYNVQSS